MTQSSTSDRQAPSPANRRIHWRRWLIAIAALQGIVIVLAIVYLATR